MTPGLDIVKRIYYPFILMFQLLAGYYNLLAGVREGFATARNWLGGDLAASAAAAALAGDEWKTQNRITGSQNRVVPYAQVPRVLGQHKVYPPMAAEPFSSYRERKQYYNLIFCFGRGPLKIEDLRIGNTPIRGGVEETAGKHTATIFEGLEYEVFLGYDTDAAPTLYPDVVDEDRVQSELLDDVWVQRTSAAAADRLSVDIAFPKGLVKFDQDGKGKVEVTFELEYRKVGDANWTANPTCVTNRKANDELYAKEASQDPVYRTAEWIPYAAPGQYEVRIKRTKKDFGSFLKLADSTWTVLRTYRVGAPVNLKGLALIAMQVKATGNLNGVLSQFSGLVTSIAKDYDSGTGTWILRATRNNASLYRLVLQDGANHEAVADARIDLVSLQTWHGDCVTNAWTYNAVAEGGTVLERLQEIAAAGRASFTMKEGKFSVVEDKTQTTIVQHFTPRNSWGFRWQKSLVEPPHALRVQFTDPTSEWNLVEELVYRDGYNKDGTVGKTAASKFESVTLSGITSRQQAKDLGAYALTIMVQRAETYELHASVENVVCTRGDLVRVTHDVPRWGTGFGRVKELRLSGAALAGVVLDEVLTMETGKSYAARFRKATGVSVYRAVNTVVGSSKELTFTVAIPGGDPWPAALDLFMFGEAALESRELLVAEIEPAPDHSAKLVLVPAGTDPFADRSANAGPATSQKVPPKDNVVPTGPSFSVSGSPSGSGRGTGGGIRVNFAKQSSTSIRKSSA